MTDNDRARLEVLIGRLRKSMVVNRQREADAIERLLAALPPDILIANLLLALRDDARTSYRHGVLESLRRWISQTKPTSGNSTPGDAT